MADIFCLDSVSVRMLGTFQNISTERVRAWLHWVISSGSFFVVDCSWDLSG